MALTEAFLEDEIHPIDIVEDLAEHHEWEFDRIEENQIAMVVQGQWRTYSITLAWSDFDETLRLMISSAVVTAEKYYPAFQLVIYDNQSPTSAMQVAIAEAYGHA